LLGVLWPSVKCHVFAERKACRARRTAVDAGSLHAIDERMVGIFIPMDYRLPAFRVGSIGLVSLGLCGWHDKRVADPLVHHTLFLAFKFGQIQSKKRSGSRSYIP
jgi:hypothetical protein